MANSFVEMKNGAAIVHIQGPAVIDTAAQLHELFTEALNSQLSIVLEIDHVTECDTSFVQMISSLCHTLSKGGRTLEFNQEIVVKPICLVIKALGFHFREQCTRVNNNVCMLSEVVKLSEIMEKSLL